MLRICQAGITGGAEAGVPAMCRESVVRVLQRLDLHDGKMAQGVYCKCNLLLRMHI